RRRAGAGREEGREGREEGHADQKAQGTHLSSLLCKARRGLPVLVAIMARDTRSGGNEKRPVRRRAVRACWGCLGGCHACGVDGRGTRALGALLDVELDLLP